MAVADVQVVQAPPHGVDDPGVAVTEVEHAAVAVAVEPAALGVEGVVEPRALPLPHDDVQAQVGVRRDLAGVDVLRERRSGQLSIGERLHRQHLRTER